MIHIMVTTNIFVLSVVVMDVIWFTLRSNVTSRSNHLKRMINRNGDDHLRMV